MKIFLIVLIVVASSSICYAQKNLKYLITGSKMNGKDQSYLYQNAGSMIKVFNEGGKLSMVIEDIPVNVDWVGTLTQSKNKDEERGNTFVKYKNYTFFYCNRTKNAAGKYRQADVAFILSDRDKSFTCVVITETEVVEYFGTDITDLH